ncbi:hypothetical protein GCM10010423_13840 [Streptomyces levis]|uniref:Uncharacterized protein n=1 Tax=Streptomyces levis TaxID=285566 RepID=A0ABN3NH51_9ACTN
MKDVHLVDAARTPIGRYDDAPAGVRPDDPERQAIRAAAGRP